MSGATECAHVFECGGAQLLGVRTLPARPATDIGVLIVVGGPQYRIGSHRQFVLLARRLCDAGIASFRFDYRGMGDSDGKVRGFEDIDADIRAAIDELCAGAAAVRRVVIWGLCDAAAAALMYAHRDSRVCGLVLLNPWLRSQSSEARARVQHYYLGHLLAGSTWARLLRGEMQVFRSLRDLLRNVLTAYSPQANRGQCDAGRRPFQQRMLDGLAGFGGPILLVLSGNDLTAAEFETAVKASRQWRRALARPGIATQRIANATHTFSSSLWREQVASLTLDWIRKC